MYRRTLLLLMAGLASLAAHAADDGAAERARMQRALNEQVMSAPFNAGDIKKAEDYAEQAKKQGVLPVPRPPAYWAPGWTCSSLPAYVGYVYTDYRNCIYYHRYYGRYWR